MFPYSENSLSEYTELAGVAKNFFASLTTFISKKFGSLVLLYYFDVVFCGLLDKLNEEMLCQLVFVFTCKNFK